MKAEPLVSKTIVQKKSDLSQHTITIDNDHQSSQKQQFLQSQTKNQCESTTVPDIVNGVIRSKGKALDTNTRTFMESQFGQDFSQVRVHTDAKAAGSSEAVDARAYTVGNHIVLNTSEYKPGTLVGDSLIAHELAHVVQQTDKASSITAESSSTLENKSLEKSANFSALGVVASILSGTKTMFGHAERNVVPGFRAGLRLQRCKRYESIQAPSFLGEQSQETLGRINRIMESGGALQQWIAFGQVIASFENPISALHTTEAAEAMAAVPIIVRSRVRQEIELLFITHGNELSREEREFWEIFLGRL